MERRLHHGQRRGFSSVLKVGNYWVPRKTDYDKLAEQLHLRGGMVAEHLRKAERR
jgi:predicted DNA binding protein